MPKQSKYTWKDILYSYWSVFFCGGDCAEDLSINLKNGIDLNPYLYLPSPDRVLERIKSLSRPIELFRTSRSTVDHQFSINNPLNSINLKLLKKTMSIKEKDNILDYDNTLIFTDKADAKNTYKKRFGYCPGVGFIGSNVVYVENRNGNCNPETMQKDTIDRMFKILNDNSIHIKSFRADGASYTFATLVEVAKYVEKLYIRARMSDSLVEEINNVKKWEKVEIDGRELYRGEVYYTPFEKIAKREGKEDLLKEYRLVITKELRDDGQINAFTGEAYNYRGILTNDTEMTNDEVVFFYNQRGAIEREFDVLKNDFGWAKMPFSKLEQNTSFLIIMVMCRNLYHYIINLFSKKFKYLKPTYRIKKFIFRFISIPSKWIKTGRTYKLRIYSNRNFCT